MIEHVDFFTKIKKDGSLSRLFVLKLLLVIKYKLLEQKNM